MPLPLALAATGMGLQAVGQGVTAYMDYVQAQRDRREKRKEFEESVRQFNVKDAREERDTPLNRLAKLLQLRQGIGQASPTDYLSSLARTQ